MYRKSNNEWQYSISMTKYGKYESDVLWSIKWMRCTLVEEINEMDHGRWNEWDGFWFVNTTKIEWW